MSSNSFMVSAPTAGLLAAAGAIGQTAISNFVQNAFGTASRNFVDRSSEAGYRFGNRLIAPTSTSTTTRAAMATGGTRIGIRRSYGRFRRLRRFKRRGFKRFFRRRIRTTRRFRRFTRYRRFRKRRVARGKLRRFAYKYRQRRPRRNFRGSINSLAKRMVVGESLPYIGFGRVRYNGITLFNPASATSSNYSPSTYQINSLSGGYGSAVGTFNYAGLYKLLYKEYLVLGAKFRVHLSASVFPSVGSTVTSVLSNISSNVPGVITFPGYWYLRFYYPGMYSADTDNRIGTHIDPSNPDSSNTTLTAKWDREIDFLEDKSVVYSRDMRTWYSAMHESAVGSTFNSLGKEMGVHVGPKGVMLTFNFSAKKIYRMPQILSGSLTTGDANPFWAPWANDPTVPVFIRFGYVRWIYNVDGPESQVIDFTPPDGRRFRAAVQSDYYIAMRTPADTADIRDADTTSFMESVHEQSLQRAALKRQSFIENQSAFKKVHFEDAQDP